MSGNYGSLGLGALKKMRRQLMSSYKSSKGKAQQIAFNDLLQVDYYVDLQQSQRATSGKTRNPGHKVSAAALAKLGCPAGKAKKLAAAASKCGGETACVEWLGEVALACGGKLTMRHDPVIKSELVSASCKSCKYDAATDRLSCGAK